VLEVVRNPHENGELKYRAQSRLLLFYIIINTNKNIDGTREFVTVIEGICADGTTLKPTIILKAEEFIAEWFKKVRGIPEDILFGRSHNGWTNEKMAMEYLGRNFGEDSITAQKAGDEYQLLLFDGHSCHKL